MTEQLVKLVIQQKVQTALNRYILKKMFDRIAVEIVNLMRDRTNKKIDIYGNNFGGYNKSYNKEYSIEYNSAKFGTTKFAGNRNTPLRATGQLFSAMACTVQNFTQTGNVVVANFKVFIDDPSQQKKVEGLQSEIGTARNMSRYSKKAWNFLGLSLKGGQADYEKRAILKIVKDTLKDQVIGSIGAKNI